MNRLSYGMDELSYDLAIGNYLPSRGKRMKRIITASIALAVSKSTPPRSLQRSPTNRALANS
jgi:hypothetical protein